jgi:tetratricopeptide (TPR) repeat protein
MRRVLVVLWLCGVANAQPQQPQPASPSGDMPPPVEAPPTPAEIAFAQGRELLDAGQFAAACASFETSLKEDPNAPGTLLNLGLCNERLGKTATALGWFRKAQFRSAETGMTDYEEAAKTATFSLAVRVPTLKITFANPPPPSGVVFLDEHQLTELDLARIEVDPNVAHRIELRIEAKPSIRTEITLKDGETGTAVIPVPAPPRPAPPVKTVVEIDHGRTRRLVAYGLAGAGVVLWGASLAVTLDAKDKLQRAEHPDDWQHYENVARWGGTSLFVGGALAIAGASVLYVTAPGVERVERTSLAPVVARDGLGVAVHGSF